MTLTTPNHAERWVDIKGYEGMYQVSDLGRVRSLRRDYRTEDKILKPRPDKKGYYRVALCKDSKCKDRKIHQLVLEAFVGPKPDGFVACHWNDQKNDNRLDNLRWGSESENMYDRVRNGRHYYARARSCRRGHLLDGRNLYQTYSGSSRCCKSCRYARHKVKKNPHLTIQEVADAKYKELMEI